MKYIQLMDCTMRDGGWVNEFSFGTEGMRDILQTVEDAGVEFVELGYLDQVKGFFHEGSMYKNLSALTESFSGVERREGTTRLVMIDYGKFDVEKLSKLGQDEDRVIDGIRLCFHKKDTKEALELGKKILDRGYKLFVQPMVASRYSDDDVKALIEDAEKTVPGFSAIYVVDSFGVMDVKNIVERLLLMDELLDPGIMLGLHTHNNLNLCIEHAKAAVELTRGTCSAVQVERGLHRDRRLIIDATLQGLGKGAGNLVIEDIASYLNENEGKNYAVDKLKELSGRRIEPMRDLYSWGYGPEYEMSSRYFVTPTYARVFFQECSKSLQELETFLSSIPENKKDSFDRKYVEEYLRKM